MFKFLFVLLMLISFSAVAKVSSCENGIVKELIPSDPRLMIPLSVDGFSVYLNDKNKKQCYAVLELFGSKFKEVSVWIQPDKGTGFALDSIVDGDSEEIEIDGLKANISDSGNIVNVRVISEGWYITAEVLFTKYAELKAARNTAIGLVKLVLEQKSKFSGESIITEEERINHLKKLEDTTSNTMKKEKEYIYKNGAKLFLSKKEFKKIVAGAKISTENSDLIIVTVQSVWDKMDREDRLEAAELFWDTWAKINHMSEKEKSLINIVNKKGELIGGSSSSNGSSIMINE